MFETYICRSKDFRGIEKINVLLKKEGGWFFFLNPKPGGHERHVLGTDGQVGLFGPSRFLNIIFYN